MSVEKTDLNRLLSLSEIVCKRLKYGSSKDEVLSVLFEMSQKYESINIFEVSIEWLVRKVSKELQLNLQFNEISEWSTKKDDEDFSIIDTKISTNETPESILCDLESHDELVVKKRDPNDDPLFSFEEEDILFMRHVLDFRWDEIERFTGRSRPTIRKKYKIISCSLKASEAKEILENVFDIDWIKI